MEPAPLYAVDAAGSHVIETGVGDRRLVVWQWTDSHSFDQPDPGPHLAMHGSPQKEGPGQSLVIALGQVPALVAALTVAATALAAVWERDGLGTQSE